MATFKLHIFKKLSNGQLLTSKSECGRGSFTPNGAPNVMFKSNAFKMAYNEGAEVCQICLMRAKNQGRV